MPSPTAPKETPSHRHNQRHPATPSHTTGFRKSTLIFTLIPLLLGIYLAFTLQTPFSRQLTPQEHTFKETTAKLESERLAEDIMPPMPPLVIPAAGRHTATVIFAHGLGDSGHGWQDAIEMIRRRQKLPHVKFILPHAPEISITVNGGMRMPGWFDIASLGGSAAQMRASPPLEDEPGILTSRTTLNTLIQSEITSGIPSERIILGGFSQGGAMSLYTGITSPVKLGGIIGLSSWLLLSKSVREHVKKFTGVEEGKNRETKILMGHGTEDPVVRFDLGEESGKILREMGYEVKLEQYRGMGHSACAEELDEVAKFIASRVPETQ